VLAQKPVHPCRLWVLLTLASLAGAEARAADPWVVYEGGDGPGKDKHVVLISGDEEYRSEEALPQLAKILARRHGFRCTVLFAINSRDGTIDPDVRDNIPGLEALKAADLMVICTRFRTLPPQQMEHIVKYLDAGKPVVGLRTATHAFAYPADSPFHKWSWDSRVKGWEGGFGRQVLGETWVNHWGQHDRQSTLGLLVKGEQEHPILRGLKDGDVWAASDVYEVHLPRDARPLVLGEVLQGMKPADKPVAGKKNDPMMPVAWVRTYTPPSGKAAARVFATTMGAAEDLQSEGQRRLLVNACYWAVGLEDKIMDKANVDLVGEYRPRHFRFGGSQKGVRPADLAIK
jgi:hypothetical protein